MQTRTCNKALLLAAAMVIITSTSTRLKADTGMCGGANITLPFADVPAANIFFCAVAEAYFSALTNGTSATTYSPSDPVPREQMAAFITRTMDQSVKRSGRRAALDQFWTTQTENNLALTTVGNGPSLVKFDGADLWVANFGSGTVSRVRTSDGRVLDSPPGWSGAASAYGVLVAMGKVFVTGRTNPGTLYQIDPALPAGAVTTVTSALGAFSGGIAFDGQRIWTANGGPAGSVSMVTLSPLTVNTVTTGFSSPSAIIYDGANMWVTDFGDNTLKKVDSGGNIIQPIISVGSGPRFPAFDGTNLWVPNASSSSVSVVRATGGLAGTVLATVSGNGLNNPAQAAFDGERILVTNNSGNSVSLWKASDLTPIGTFSTGPGTTPFGAVGDGVNFWITFNTNPGKLARF